MEASLHEVKPANIYNQKGQGNGGGWRLGVRSRERAMCGVWAVMQEGVRCAGTERWPCVGSRGCLQMLIMPAWAHA